MTKIFQQSPIFSGWTIVGILTVVLWPQEGCAGPHTRLPPSLKDLKAGGPRHAWETFLDNVFHYMSNTWRWPVDTRGTNGRSKRLDENVIKSILREAKVIYELNAYEEWRRIWIQKKVAGIKKRVTTLQRTKVDDIRKQDKTYRAKWKKMGIIAEKLHLKNMMRRGNKKKFAE